MKRLSTLCFFTLLHFTLFSQTLQIDTLTLKWEHYQLDNGLEVVLQPDKTVDDVSVEFWLKDGISMDEPGEFGFAHFFEHVMPYSPIDSIKREALNGYRTGSNAQVRKDFSRFFQQVKPAGLGILLEVAAGRLKAGTERITPERVEYQRKRVLAEIERNARNPQWSAPDGMAIAEGVFGKGRPYGHSGYGKVEYNENFKLVQFHKRYNEIVYANNTALFVVGHFDVEEAKKLIQQNFSDVPSKKKKPIKVEDSKHSGKKVSMPASLRCGFGLLLRRTARP